jgi:hypothetical protein
VHGEKIAENRGKKNVIVENGRKKIFVFETKT